jgi:hypothetical protein
LFLFLFQTKISGIASQAPGNLGLLFRAVIVERFGNWTLSKSETTNRGRGDRETRRAET